MKTVHSIVAYNILSDGNSIDITVWTLFSRPADSVVLKNVKKFQLTRIDIRMEAFQKVQKRIQGILYAKRFLIAF